MFFPICRIFFPLFLHCRWYLGNVCHLVHTNYVACLKICKFRFNILKRLLLFAETQFLSFVFINNNSNNKKKKKLVRHIRNWILLLFSTNFFVILLQFLCCINKKETKIKPFSAKGLYCIGGYSPFSVKHFLNKHPRQN